MEVPLTHRMRLSVIAAGLSSLLLLSACGVSSAPGASGGGAAQKPAGPPPAPVSTAAAAKGPITAGVTFTGDVTASQQVNLAPKVAGLVVKLMADVGTHVTAGQVVAQLDHLTQDAAVAQAQAQLEVAKANQAKTQAQGRPEEVAKAQAAVAQQQAKLTELKNQGRAETVAEAQANLDSANAKLQALQSGTDQQQIASDQAALDTAKAKLTLLQSAQQVDAFRQAVATAKNTLYSNQIARDASCANVGNGPQPATGKGTTCQSAQAAVNAAQTALDQANDNLAINVDPNTTNQAVNAVKQAQATLDKDRTNAPSDLQQAQSAVASAQQALALAQTPNQPEDIAQQQALVTSAPQQVSEAATPFLPTDLQAAQANVDAAQSNLDAAVVTQQLTQVTAPFTGVVSARLLSEGALANTTVPIFTIISDSVEVDLPVAQDQLAEIKEGQAAQLSTPAVTGAIDGKIAAISPAADPKSRTFLVTVVPAVQDGKLKPGMSAAVTIATQQKADALLIPKDAITTDPNTNAEGVFVVQSGQSGQTAVFKTPTFGVSDDKNVEVVSGLNPGDVVIVSGQGALTNNQRVRLVNGGAQGQGATGAQGSAGASAKPQGAGQASGKPQGAGQTSGKPQGSGSPQASAAPSGQ
mgnify:CR=1 FL=1